MQKYTDQILSMAIEYTPKILLALITLIVGFWIIRKIHNMLEKALDARNIDVTVKPFLLSLVSIGLKVLLLFTVASMFGVETASFIAILGAMAFAIGMALQGSLGHFASGVMLLTFKPYKVGDLVELSGKIGVVKAIQIFNTILITPDNKTITIPNGVVTSDVITNISGLGEIRVDMVFGIGYSDDIDRARAVIQQVADKCPKILTSKPVDIFVCELGDSSVNFAVRPWVKSEHYWEVHFYMHEQIKKEFDASNIEIPFPQRTVHLQK